MCALSITMVTMETVVKVTFNLFYSNQSLAIVTVILPTNTK